MNFFVSTFFLGSGLVLGLRFYLARRMRRQNEMMKKFLDKVSKEKKLEEVKECPKCGFKTSEPICPKCSFYIEGLEDLDAISDEQDLEE